jgi:hypothetical protein
MSPPVGITASSNAGAAAIAPAASAPTTELLNLPSTLNSAAAFIATVLERSPDGVIMLRSTYGMLAFKTPQSLSPGAKVEVRFTPGNPPSVSIVALGDPEPEDAEPPMRLDLGTTLTATLISDGTRVTLRVGAPLDDNLRRETGDIFHRACAAAGYHGDIMFAHANAIAVAPLTPLRTSIELRI